jgi:hypothetical protein
MRSNSTGVASVSMEVCFISRCLATTSVFNLWLLINDGIRRDTSEYIYIYMLYFSPSKFVTVHYALLKAAPVTTAFHSL